MRRRVPSLAYLAGSIRSPKVRAYIRRVSVLCPAVLAYLGRHAHGTLWHLVGQAKPEQNGLYVSAPYVTGPDSGRVTSVYPGIHGETHAEAERRYADLAARRRWPGFPPLPCSPGYMLGRAWE